MRKGREGKGREGGELLRGCRVDSAGDEISGWPCVSWREMMFFFPGDGPKGWVFNEI